MARLVSLMVFIINTIFLVSCAGQRYKRDINPIFCYRERSTNLSSKIALGGCFSTENQNNRFSCIFFKENIFALEYFSSPLWQGDIPEVQAIETPPPSLGEARSQIKRYLANLENIEETQLLQDLEKAGFENRTPANKQIKNYYRVGRQRNKGIEIRVDPPQKNVEFNHLHFEYRNQSFDKYLNPVRPNSNPAHIKRK